ncbi:hypothetical protein PIIN_11686 [Serendipita indica DSM 11827]|uniref:Uncharacterized protein n=1 Tax=Serendipita indica (strain DSM 11827) TaxID=1109443 RepID=G4TEB1_SERID|nr:hypothetical protein PIIN_11686 [Serendipita indica DSM 11827]
MALPILEVHTPSNSFAIPHSLKGDSLSTLFTRLSHKVHGTVGPGWIKYEYNGSYWDLDDGTIFFATQDQHLTPPAEADYSIFAWRVAPADASSPSPVIYVHDPLLPLPVPPAYQNLSYYAFRKHTETESTSSPARTQVSASTTTGAGPAAAYAREHSDEPSRGADLHRRNTIHSTAPPRSIRSTKSKRSRFRDSSPMQQAEQDEANQVPKYKRDFLKFHGENGNRVVVGTFGPVRNVEMLLKKGYRHVYMSRHFAKRHGLVPPNVEPGWMGYGGLVK